MNIIKPISVGAMLLAILCMDRASADDLTIYLMTMPPHVMDTPERKGLVGDIVLEAMKRAGFGTKIMVEPNPRAMAAVQAGEDLFITALARVPEREGKYTWVAPIVPVYRAFFTLGQRPAGSLEEAKARYKSIAVSRGTANYNILVASGFPLGHLHEVNAGDTAPKMLLGGRVDAWFNLVPESKDILKQIGESRVLMGKPIAPTDLYLACSAKCSPATTAKLVRALDSMKTDGTLSKIIARYDADL